MKWIITVFLSLFIFNSCKQMVYPLGAKANGKKENVLPSPKVQKERAASAASAIESHKDFYSTIWNQEFVVNLAALPKSGTVPNEKIPYSGFWYPYSHGGTGIEWDSGGSALEKYDQVFNGGTMTATQWEEKNHNAGNARADWDGHCNGWSGAAQRHKEPAHEVKRNGVTFKPRDIKALLTEVYMSAKTGNLGGERCNSSSFSGPSGRSDPTVMGVCEDSNPGEMHVVVANWIGRAQHTVIMDRSVGVEVWNSPTYKYSYTSQDVSRETAMTKIIGSSGSTYRFNSLAQSFALVAMTLTYTKSSTNEPDTSTHESESQTYQYILELDISGNILGGEWTQESQSVHPDFFWLALEPSTPSGSTFYGNPGLNPNEVIKLWAESIDADQNNPPQDIMEPLWNNSWGKFVNYEIALDGASTGSVFLGKNTFLVIKPEGDYAGADITVDVALNGVNLTTLKSQGTTPLVYEFAAKAGINRLDFTWKRGTTVLSKEGEDFTRFHAIP